MNIDTVFTVGAIVGMAYVFSQYHKQSAFKPSTPLPFDDVVDVSRWRQHEIQPNVLRGDTLSSPDPTVQLLS